MKKPSDSTLLQKYFGFDVFRAGQKEAVEHLLQGENTLVIMPTGAGKSLIYQYAALALRNGERAAVSLVLSPLIALMKDQVDGLQARGIAATYINSSISLPEQRQRTEAMLRGDYQMVYIAPERLRQASFVEALRRIEIQLFVIDEAHCISSWGHDFRPDYRRIAEARKDLGTPLTVALTATATTLVQDDIVQLLEMPQARRVVTGFNRPNLSFEVLYASGAHAKLQALAGLLSPETGGACIVYAGTRKDAEKVATFVKERLSLNSGYYHAGMAADQREEIQDAFSSGKLNVVVATNAFGMGIDRQDVRLVVHYNLPGTLEAYYQEAGRAGRDGLPSRAVLLFSPQDRMLQEFFIQQNNITVPQLHHLFQKLGREDYRVQDLSRDLGWAPHKLRLALAHLENSNMLEPAEDGLTVRALGKWDEEAARANTKQLEDYANHRKSQLDQMSHYAQADACRRQILLAYFSDRSEAQSIERCCDYCSRQKQRQKQHQGQKQGQKQIANSLDLLSRTQRATLIILDSVRQVALGRQRTAQMLLGSNSQKMSPALRSQRYYGRLAPLGQKQIKRAIDELLQTGYLQHRSSNNFTVLALTKQGQQALELREMIELKCLKEKPKTVKNTIPILPPKGKTSSAETLRLLQEGLSLEEVAEQRQLSGQTIGSHMSALLEQGELELDEYVTPAVCGIVEQCLERLEQEGNSLERLRPIKDLLPPDISYNELKFVLGAWRRKKNLGPPLSS